MLGVDYAGSSNLDAVKYFETPQTRGPRAYCRSARDYLDRVDLFCFALGSGDRTAIASNAFILTFARGSILLLYLCVLYWPLKCAIQSVNFLGQEAIDVPMPIDFDSILTITINACFIVAIRVAISF